MRDKYRAVCINSMRDAVNKARRGNGISWEMMEIAFDALNGIARVNPIEATDIMVACGEAEEPDANVGFRLIWRAMSAAGDLTNPPEKKP